MLTTTDHRVNYKQNKMPGKSCFIPHCYTTSEDKIGFSQISTLGANEEWKNDLHVQPEGGGRLLPVRPKDAGIFACPAGGEGT